MFEKLHQRITLGNARSLIQQYEAVDFLSNDYLGLARAIELQDNIANLNTLKSTSTHLNGATGSRLLSGNQQYVEEVEKLLSHIFDCESALIFSSGYDANLSIMSCLPQKNDTIIHDELIHASIIDGARLSYARRLSFKHNDTADLEKKLQLSSGDKYVVVESIYSMDGDESPLAAIIEVCQKYNAYLIIDEAHSTGIVGKDGSGILCDQALHKSIFARIYTFGKGMGIHGACICGSNVLRQYLINFARPFIFSTAMPTYHYAAIEASFKYLNQHIYLQKLLAENIVFFKKCVANANKSLQNQLLPSNSAIQIIIVSGNEYATSMAESIRKKGFEVRAILSPTVAIGQERLRICLHAYNTKTEIEDFVKLIDQLIIT